MKDWARLPQACLKAGQTVAVIGGGIAGTSVAALLAQAGARVILFERREHLAAGASGNPAGVILPAPFLHPCLQGRFFHQAYARILSVIGSLNEAGANLSWHQTGIVDVCVKPRLSKIHEALMQGGGPGELARPLTAQAASELAGFPIRHPALYYPDGGWLQPDKLCRALASHPAIDLRLHSSLSSLAYADGFWWLFDGQQQLLSKASAVVLANAGEMLELEQTRWLPLTRARGQLALIDPQHFRDFPKRVVCYKGYLIPHTPQGHLLGATWSYASQDRELSQDDQTQLIEQTMACLPDLAQLSSAPLRGRVSFRALSPDHLPLVGPVPDVAAFSRDYGDLHHGRKKSYPAGTYLPGLFLTTGHGGRGLVSAPFCAQVLLSQIMGKPAPCSADLIEALHPARFLIRALRRGKPPVV